MRRWFTAVLAAVALVAVGTTVLRAHDDRPAPVVALRVVPNGTVLTIDAKMPIAALMDANLPQKADRTLDTAALAEPLQLIARDLASALDVAQDGQPLPFPTTAARLATDGTAVDVTLTYVMSAGDAPLSARLRPFRSVPDPIPTRAEYVASPDSSWSFFVGAGAETVTFNPTTGQTLRQFVRRGAEAALAGRAGLFFVLALVFPLRRREDVQRYAAIWYAALVAGAAVDLLIAPPAAAAPLDLGIAASTVVVATLAGLVGAAPRWLAALAALFGAAHGVSLGTTFAALRAYSGSHTVVGFLTFVLVVALALAWLLLLLTAVVDALLSRTALPMRAVGIAALVYACHGALHLMTDEIALLSTLTAWNPDRLLMIAAALWVGVSLVSGAAFNPRSRASAA